MTTMISVRGYRFWVESDGFAGHDAERDAAIAEVERLLGDDFTSNGSLAAMHANPDHAGLVGVASEAVAKVCRDWHDKSAPSLIITPT
jgi:hypothetical protein